MRLVALPITLVLVASACASIVGLESPEQTDVAPKQPTPAQPQPSPTDANNSSDGSDQDAAPIKTTLRCGEQDCLVGRDICCVDPTAATAKCVQGEQCPAPVDAGPDAKAPPPPLRCISYTQCPLYAPTCCYDRVTGSVCAFGCESPKIELCENGDLCGIGKRCIGLPDPPAQNIKQCR